MDMRSFWSEVKLKEILIISHVHLGHPVANPTTIGRWYPTPIQSNIFRFAGGYALELRPNAAKTVRHRLPNLKA